MLNVTMCAQLRSATLLIVITDAFKLIKKKLSYVRNLFITAHFTQGFPRHSLKHQPMLAKEQLSQLCVVCFDLDSIPGL